MEIYSIGHPELHVSEWLLTVVEFTTSSNTPHYRSRDVTEGFQLELAQKHGAAQEQQAVDELVEVLRAAPAVAAAGDADDRRRSPDVAPAAGEHARPHGVAGREEREHVVEELVREGADAVRAARPGVWLESLAVARPSHSVEQAVGAGAHSAWKTRRRRQEETTTRSPP